MDGIRFAELVTDKLRKDLQICAATDTRRKKKSRQPKRTKDSEYFR